jgi:hypothetical protein
MKMGGNCKLSPRLLFRAFSLDFIYRPLLELHPVSRGGKDSGGAIGGSPVLPNIPAPQASHWSIREAWSLELGRSLVLQDWQENLSEFLAQLHGLRAP